MSRPYPCGTREGIVASLDAHTQFPNRFIWEVLQINHNKPKNIRREHKIYLFSPLKKKKRAKNTTMASTSERDLHVFVENSFEALNTQMEMWYKEVMAQDAVIVAIARKAPRLLCYCKQQFPDLYNPNIVTFSDIAVPFIDWEKTKRHCLVIDDAIYHGTTFEKVLETVKDTINSKDAEVKGFPLVVTQDALSAPKIVDSLIDGWNLIDSDKCNFFVDTIISRFFELGKPYDIEYPLFYVEIPKGRYSKEEIDNKIEKVLDLLAAMEEDTFKVKPVYFKNTNYRREDRRTFSAFTYCTDYVFPEFQDSIKPDFSKLRIFHNEESICIASMAPHTINERSLNFGNCMFEGTMGKIWELLLAAFRKNNKDGYDCCHQGQKSIVIMANYLLSVNHFMCFKEKLSRLFSAVLGINVDFSLKSEDLQWLVGKDLALAILGNLMKLKEHDEIYTPFKDSDTVKSSIPAMYKRDYLTQLTIDNMYDKSTASSIISNIFSDLHWIVEVRSRRQPRNTYDRLEFGESLSSITEMCENLLPNSGSLKNIHKNIDMRIDRGSMVPDYVCVNDAFSSYWKRMFRSGENEDLTRDQHFRICINALTLYLRKIKSTSISFGEIRLLLALLANMDNIYHKAPREYNSLFATKTRICYDGGEYKILVTQDEEETDLLQKLDSYHIIIETENESYEMAYSSYIHLLSKGLPLSEEQYQELLRIIDFVAYAHNNIDHAVICELKNYACVSESTIEKAFNDWRGEVECFLKDEQEKDFNELVGKFVDLYVSIPEPQITITDNLFASSKVGTWMKKQVFSEDIHRLSQTMIDRLHAAFYILNLWNRYNGEESSIYYSAGMYDSFKTLVSCYRQTEENDSVANMLSSCGPKLATDSLMKGRAYTQNALCALLAKV